MAADKKSETFLDKAYAPSSTDETHAMYERWADSYDQELQEHGYQQPERCAVTMKKMLPEGGLILDIGCGTGLSGIALKEHGFSTIDGCDFSPAMLEKATETNAYSRLFKADLNQPPIDCESDLYDGITVVGVFSMQHVHADAMDEIVRLAKPGAPIIIGLNDKFYRLGHLTGKLDALSAIGRLSQINHEHGAHIPEIGLTGWVITLRKTQ